MIKYFLSLLLSSFLLCPLPALAVIGTLTAAANPPVASPTMLSSSGVAFIKASSGTMGNNGAISAMTALPRTFTEGAWLYLPAGAVAAGVPSAASWLWFVGSSTTAGTVYNSTYTSGQPTVGVQTAFVTTGPGAYTGIITTISGPVITMPANMMGINGSVHLRWGFEANNSAGAKTTWFKFGSAAATGLSSITTNLSGINDVLITNRGVATAQEWGQFRHHESTVSSVGSTSAANLAVTTTANVDIALQMATAVATDHNILDHYIIEVFTQN
jgi:hypothetical protein